MFIMRPTEGTDSSSFEMEISPSEFCQDLAVLIIEGRIPEFTSMGRRSGSHCWPISSSSTKTCSGSWTQRSPGLCQLVSSIRKSIHKVPQEENMLIIETYITIQESELFKDEGQRIILDSSNDCKNVLLLERWKVYIAQNSEKRSQTNVNMLFQAVNSFLHFSQLSALWTKSCGAFPGAVKYRILYGIQSNQDFEISPEIHNFPAAMISVEESVFITVSSRPRMEINALKDLIQKNIITCFDGGGTTSDFNDMCTGNSQLGNDIEPSVCTKRPLASVKVSNHLDTTAECLKYHADQSSSSSTSGKRPEPSAQSSNALNSSVRCLYFGHDYSKQIESIYDKIQSYPMKFSNDDFKNSTQEITEVRNPPSGTLMKNGFSSLNSMNIFSMNGRNDYSARLPFASQSTIQSKFTQNGSSGQCLTDLIKQIDIKERTVKGSSDISNANCEERTKLGHRFEKEFEFHKDCDFDLDSSIYSNVQDFVEVSTTETEKHLLPRESSSQELCLRTKLLNNKATKLYYSGSVCALCDFQNVDCVHGTPPKKPKLEDGVPGDKCIKEGKFRCRTKSVSPNFPRTKKDEPPVGCKGVQPRRLTMMSRTEPIFNAKTGLPMSSSPAPIKKPCKVSESDLDNSVSRSSSSDEFQSSSYGLSKSAPASTRLLGNFEESLLQCRMPVNGTLKGFVAELSASGSFCPKHVKLPVQVHFFQLSDDNAPSPYLGFINLNGKKIGKKGYQVPRKGTVQLTLFNPNKTVIKVFIVLYDVHDMPPSSQTFIRQRIVSFRKEDNCQEIPYLHYLTHLRFISTRHNHVYLHTNIRVIFPQQTPDLESRAYLRTFNDGPTDPKYVPYKCQCRSGDSDNVFEES